MTQKKGFTYKYARKAVMVDALVLGFIDWRLSVLLIRRKEEPFVGSYALPGGHVEINETLEEAVARELFEETHVQESRFTQIHTFSKVKRDPREPTVSTAFYVLVIPSELKVKAGSDADRAEWKPLNKLPSLAFDHKAILEMGLEKMREEIFKKPIVAPMMQKVFTMADLHYAYENLTGKSLDRGNFRREFLKNGLIEEVKAPASSSNRDPFEPRRKVKHYRFKLNP